MEKGVCVNVHHCWNAIDSLVALGVLSYVWLWSQGVLFEGEWKTWAHTRPECFTSKTMSAYQNQTSNFTHSQWDPSALLLQPVLPHSFLMLSLPQNLFCHFRSAEPKVLCTSLSGVCLCSTDQESWPSALSAPRTQVLIYELPLKIQRGVWAIHSSQAPLGTSSQAVFCLSSVFDKKRKRKKVSAPQLKVNQQGDFSFLNDFVRFSCCFVGDGGCLFVFSPSCLTVQGPYKVRLLCADSLSVPCTAGMPASVCAAVAAVCLPGRVWFLSGHESWRTGAQNFSLYLASSHEQHMKKNSRFCMSGFQKKALSSFFSENRRQMERVNIVNRQYRETGA